MEIKNILIGCDYLIIGVIHSLSFEDELYEDFFPIMSGGRIRFDRNKLNDSGAFYKEIITSTCQNKLLKIMIVTTDSEDPDFKEEIIYPNVLVVKSGYTYATEDYLIADEIYFAIAGSE